MSHVSVETLGGAEVADARQRRDRLAVLKARRQNLVEPLVEHSFSRAETAQRDWVAADADPTLSTLGVPAPTPATAPAPTPATAPAKTNLLVDLMSGKLQGGKAARAQMMSKAMQMLTRTPLDADGMIEGTPFSSAGLTLLVQLLRGRAEATNASGSKAVQAVLGFLQAQKGEAATPQGLSLAKLQMIAQRIGGAGQGAAPMAAQVRAAPAALAGASPAQRQIMGKLHYLLTKTPADARGMVPGSGFSAAGVARLMVLLRQRAANSQSQGGRMAARMVASLAAAPGEAEVIDGASLQKLRNLATRLAAAG